MQSHSILLFNQEAGAYEYYVQLHVCTCDIYVLHVVCNRSGMVGLLLSLLITTVLRHICHPRECLWIVQESSAGGWSSILAPADLQSRGPCRLSTQLCFLFVVVKDQWFCCASVLGDVKLFSVPHKAPNISVSLLGF